MSLLRDMGLMVFWGVCILFSLSYVLVIHYVFKTRFSVWNGVLFGLILMIFPFFFQFPSMGLGMMALNTPYPMQHIARAFVSHLSFGFGLGLGGVAFQYWANRRQE